MLKKFFSWIFRTKETSSVDLEKLIEQNIGTLEKRLDYKIFNKHFYIKALTHRSYMELYPELKKSNERLEFLGDSVLNMITGKFLFENYQEEEEGFLTKARAALVNRYRLAKAAQDLELEKFLLYNHKYLRDSVEGLQTIIDYTEKFIIKWIIEPYEEDERYLIDTNYKGQLLEYAHANKLENPRYIIKNIEGPDHKKEFTVDVYIADKYLGTGKGKSKKTAEQNASQKAIQLLKKESEE